MSAFTGVLGIFALLALAFLLSNNKKRIRWRTICAALLMQISIGAFVLYIPWGIKVLEFISGYVDMAISYGNVGLSFLFGDLANAKGNLGFVFAFKVLPLIVFFSALIAVFYHLGIMQLVIKTLGGGLEKVLKTSKTESMSSIANIFVGQSEAPLVIKPYMPKMTDSEFFAVMVGGLASISGTTLAGYASLGVPMEYLVAASFMAAPGGLLFAKLMMPETEKPTYTVDPNISFDDVRSVNVIEAAASGASSGMHLAVHVGAMLLAVIGLVALFNGMVGGIAGWFGYELSLQMMLGWIFAPFAFLLGVPWQDTTVAGSLIGQKIILNEFVAYVDFSHYLRVEEGYQLLENKTKVIISFALCGFANISSIAILMGGLGVLAPNRRSFIAQWGIKGVIAGTCSNLMSASIAGIFLTLAIS